MDAKLNVPIATLSTKDNVNLTKELNGRIKKSVRWNSYQTILAKVWNQVTYIYEILSASFQGVKRLFVLAYTIASGVANNEAVMKNDRKYFLWREEINNYNILTDGTKF